MIRLSAHQRGRAAFAFLQAERRFLHSSGPVWGKGSVLVSKDVLEEESERLRPGSAPLYIGPSQAAISVLKRTCLGFGIVGLYFSELVFATPSLSNELAYLLTAGSIAPLPLVHYFTKDYVARIFRLHGEKMPQTLESLETDETFLAEKISFTGRSHYTSRFKASDLRITNKKLGWANWAVKDKLFYVKDDIGGLKMERLWGIAEKNSGVDNGRDFS